MIAGAVLNPVSDGFPAELDINDAAAGYQVMPPADIPPAQPKPAYASSYDTEGSIATDEAHYENAQIGWKIRVFADDDAADPDAQLEQRLNALYHMVGQMNREGGVLGITTPNGTVCFFDLVPEVTATATLDKLYVARRFTFVDFVAQRRPFWRGEEIQVL